MSPVDAHRRLAMDGSVRNERQARSRRAVQLDWHLLALTALLGIEALLFYWQVAEQIAPFYPQHFDQAALYSETYDLIARFRAQGWRALVEQYIDGKHASGITFIVQGAIMALWGGVGRTALLSVNLLYFLALQLVLFTSLRTRAPDASFAWIAIGLLLLCGTVFLGTGGIYDYRMDFAAFCLYGIWICAVLWSDTFRKTGRSIIVALVAALLISLRYFVVIYVAGIYGGLLLATLLGRRRAASPFRRGVLAYRARNILISGGLVAAIVLPLLVLSWTTIYNYYVVGHVLNDEKYIRANEGHIYTLLDHILWYPKLVLFHHIGIRALIVGGALAALGILATAALDRTSLRDLAARLARSYFDFLTIVLAIIIPLAILTLDISKSPVVGGIVVVPAVLGVVLFCAACWPRRWLSEPIRVPAARLLDCFKAMRLSLGSKRTGAIACAAVVSVGMATFVTRGTSSQHYLERADLERIASINREIARYVVTQGGRATVSFDRVVDYLNQSTIRIEAFERFQEDIAIVPAFGAGQYGIFPTPRDVALALIAKSDVIVLTDPTTGRSWPYPMNIKIREYWGELSAWTKEHRALIYSTQIAGIPFQAFARPPVAVAGASAGWITSAGISITADASHLARWPLIVLKGEASYDTLEDPPHPKAILVDAAGAPGIDLPTTLVRQPHGYEMTIDTRKSLLPSAGSMSVRLTFDRASVPQAPGINRDTHKLVLRAPVERELRASPPN